jgi:hypothetical protein
MAHQFSDLTMVEHKAFWDPENVRNERIDFWTFAPFTSSILRVLLLREVDAAEQVLASCPK